MAAPGLNLCCPVGVTGYSGPVVEEPEETSARRRDVARVLLRLSASCPDTRDWLPDKLIVVLDEDPVGATLEYMDLHHPDGGYLVRVEGEGRIEVVEVRRCSASSCIEDHAVEETLIHPDGEIGMLFDYLRSFPGERLHCIAERPEHEVAIAPNGDLGNLLVPGG